jgi:hypothetical protein
LIITVEEMIIWARTRPHAEETFYDEEDEDDFWDVPVKLDR